MHPRPTSQTWPRGARPASGSCRAALAAGSGRGLPETTQPRPLRWAPTPGRLLTLQTPRLRFPRGRGARGGGSAQPRGARLWRGCTGVTARLPPSGDSCLVLCAVGMLSVLTVSTGEDCREESPRGHGRTARKPGTLSAAPVLRHSLGHIRGPRSAPSCLSPSAHESVAEGWALSGSCVFTKALIPPRGPRHHNPLDPLSPSPIARGLQFQLINSGGTPHSAVAAPSTHLTLTGLLMKGTAFEVNSKGPEVGIADAVQSLSRV